MKRLLIVTLLPLPLVFGASQPPDPFDQTDRPVITTEPRLTAPAGFLYVYGAQAVDPEGDLVCWRLTDAPSGAYLHYDFQRPNDVLVIWRANNVPPGHYKFTLLCDDRHWHYTKQKWHVDVY